MRLSIDAVNGKVTVGQLREFLRTIDLVGLTDNAAVSSKSHILTGVLQTLIADGVPSPASAAASKEILMPSPGGPPTAALPTVPIPTPIPPPAS